MEDEKAKFKVRVIKWAEKLEITLKSITIRSMKNKWASYSTSGRVTFDSILLDFPTDLQDYVIVHELLHSQIPNHGRLWKSLMRAHIGEYEIYEQRLKEIQSQFKKVIMQ